MAESKEVAIHCDMDEMYLSTKDTFGKRDGYYETKGKQAPKNTKRVLKMVAKNFMRNRSLPPRSNFVVDCS